MTTMVRLRPARRTLATWAYAPIALILFGVDLFVYAETPPLPWAAILIDGVSASLLALLVRYPRLAGASLLMTYIIVALTINPPLLPVIAAHFILIEWISRRFTYLTIAALFLFVTLIFYPAEYIESSALVEALLLPPAILAGFAKLRHRNKELEFDAVTAQLTAESEELRQRVISVLHDSIANDLSLVLMRTRSLLDSEEGERYQHLVPIEAGIASAYEDLRTVMKGLQTPEQANGDAQTQSEEEANRLHVSAVNNAVTMLEHHEFSVVQDCDWNSLVERLDSRSFNFLTLAIREALVNAAKYAMPHTTVAISQDVSDNQVAVDVVSERIPDGDKKVRSEESGPLRGGFGLKGLKVQAHDLGGEVTVTSTHDRWMVGISLPTATPKDASS